MLVSSLPIAPLHGADQMQAAAAPSFGKGVDMTVKSRLASAGHARVLQRLQIWSWDGKKSPDSPSLDPGEMRPQERVDLAHKHLVRSHRALASVTTSNPMSLRYLSGLRSGSAWDSTTPSSLYLQAQAQAQAQTPRQKQPSYFIWRKLMSDCWKARNFKHPGTWRHPSIIIYEVIALQESTQVHSGFNQESRCEIDPIAAKIQSFVISRNPRNIIGTFITRSRWKLRSSEACCGRDDEAEVCSKW